MPGWRPPSWIWHVVTKHGSLKLFASKKLHDSFNLTASCWRLTELEQQEFYVPALQRHVILPAASVLTQVHRGPGTQKALQILRAWHGGLKLSETDLLQKVTLELEALSKHEAVAGTLLRQISIGVLRSWFCKVYQLLRAVSQPGFSSNRRGVERPELKREFQRKCKWKSWATQWLSPNEPAVRQEPSERKKGFGFQSPSPTGPFARWASM